MDAQTQAFVERLGAGSTVLAYLEATPTTDLPLEWLDVGASSPGLLYDAFAIFCGLEYSGENLDYLRAVNEYAGSSDRDTAVKIYTTYLSSSAPKQVNLSASSGNLLGLFEADEATGGENWDAYAPQTHELMEKSKDDIGINLADCWGRFRSAWGQIRRDAEARKRRRRFIFG